MKNKRIHFVGIKGVGMAPLAIIAKQAGMEVSGCDVAETFITDASLKAAGITPLVGFAASHIADAAVVVTTGAHGGFSNEEVKAAKEAGKDVLLQGQAVGKFMEGKLLGKKAQQGISILGTHGKTTTTAMIATIFTVAKKDPSFLIGTSSIPSLGSAGHFGKGSYFVAEADEYATDPKLDKTPKFMWQHPTIGIITNIEHDHPDIYPTIGDVVAAFTKFSEQVQSVLIGYGDDPHVKKILSTYTGRAVSYGMTANNDFSIQRVSVSGGKTYFWVDAKGATLGEFSIGVMGEHNALNALAAIITAIEAGIPIETIKKALRQFVGSKRRLEYKGRLATGALLYDDYAHHPTEIRKTLQALRQNFPKEHIVCIFQPHTLSRTKELFTDFVHAFQGADAVLLTDIFTSQRESNDGSISTKDLFEAMSRYYSTAMYAPTLPDVVAYVKQKKFNAKTIVVTMGAGDVYTIQKQLDMEENG